MAKSKKVLQQAAIKFRRENPSLYKACAFLCDVIAGDIRKFGITEETVSIRKNKLFTYVND